MTWFADLRLLSLARRAVIAWETMARIMAERREEEISTLAAAKKSSPKQMEFGTLNLDEVNRNYRIARQATLLDEEEEES